MTTQRKHSMGVSRAGINFVRQLVEGANCTFQEIEQSNDLGNDAYIEFVRDEAATGCCIAVQIKSGGSYVTPDGSFFLPADRHHFEYWASHLLPVCGIVFDPETGRAAWCDITEHLRNHPEVIEHGPFRLAVPASAQLTADTFTNVQAHFARYQQQYSDDAHFGAALDQFAPVHSSPRRVEALRSLFSFHRNRAATWCYVASLLKSMEDPEVLRRTVYALVHLPGHGDIFWHRDNEIEPAAKLGGVGFMQLTFGRDEVVKLLSAVDEGGFTRGSIGQAVHALIHRKPSVGDVLFG